MNAAERQLAEKKKPYRSSFFCSYRSEKFSKWRLTSCSVKSELWAPRGHVSPSYRLLVCHAGAPDVPNIFSPLSSRVSVENIGWASKSPCARLIRTRHMSTRGAGARNSAPFSHLHASVRLFPSHFQTLSQKGPGSMWVGLTQHVGGGLNHSAIDAWRHVGEGVRRSKFARAACGAHHSDAPCSALLCDA